MDALVGIFVVALCENFQPLFWKLERERVSSVASKRSLLGAFDTTEDTPEDISRNVGLGAICSNK